jgi:serine/threonine protein kinase
MEQFVSVIEGFRILREIGRGGMGVVYEAEEEVLGRRVALKVLPPSSTIDARHVERFRREAKVAARLHHTNIVPVFGVGQQGDRHFYVMQYINGRGLDSVVRELRHLKSTDLPPPRSTPGNKVTPAQAAELKHVVEQLAGLCESWGKPGQAAEWRRRLGGRAAVIQSKP